MAMDTVTVKKVGCAVFGLSILLLCATVTLADFTGQVVSIIDGDSIKVMHDGKAEDVRLQGIDCPEKGQAFGKRAKQFTSEQAFRRVVTVQEKGRDRFGRTLADVILPDGRSLNHELLKAGYAWWFRKYSKDPTLGNLEDKARLAKRGLWADPESVPPWEYRRSQSKPMIQSVQ